jgi:hypothetical protein
LAVLKAIDAFTFIMVCRESNAYKLRKPAVKGR